MSNLKYRMNDAYFWGVCPSDEPPCPRSYKNGARLKDWLVGWVSRNFFPGAGYPEKAELPPEYRGVFQPSSDDSGFCPECGTPLFFRATLPSLGRCGNCSQEYSEADLTHRFCPHCGHPVSINDEAKRQYLRGRALATLFEDLPALQKYGFLLTHRS